jgi:hypothetical protein
MRHLPQNFNQNVYETDSTFAEIDPLGQGHMRLEQSQRRPVASRRLDADKKGTGELINPNFCTARN